MTAHDVERENEPAELSAREFFFEIEHELSEDSESTAEGLERSLSVKMRELARRLVEEHLQHRAAAARSHQVVSDENGDVLPHVRDRTRTLQTQFGDAEVPRPSHSGPGQPAVRPLDDELELPARRYSYPMQELAVVAAIRDSYDEAIAELRRYLGDTVPKRQLEELVHDVSRDVSTFYEERVSKGVEARGSVVVAMADGKGIPMLRRDLREPTRKARLQSKLEGRRSKGEKRHRKREAAVGVVFSTDPYARTADHIIGGILGVELADEPPSPRPAAVGKRVWASVEQNKEAFFYDLTAEALRHVPTEGPKPVGVYLVDGARAYQRPGKEILLDTLELECERVFIFVDLVHVSEYLWDAAWCFFDEGDRKAEKWVVKKMRALFEGKASRVAAAIRATATRRKLKGNKRKRADRAANYLLNNKHHLRYDEALKYGLPVTTSLVEGACASFVRDRFEKPGARWSLDGSEALLKIRGVYRSGDWEEYWRFHVEREQRRLRESRPSYTTRTNSNPPRLRVIPGGLDPSP